MTYIRMRDRHPVRDRVVAILTLIVTLPWLLLLLVGAVCIPILTVKYLVTTPFEQIAAEVFAYGDALGNLLNHPLVSYFLALAIMAWVVGLLTRGES
jgi:hypothetical protein